MRYSVLLLRRAAYKVGLGLVVIVAGILPAGAVASSYQVQATVPYPAPSQAAVFDPGYDGSTVSNAQVTLTGTCQVQNPADVVVIVRGSTTLGSTVCNGTFSLQVMLVEGSNTLVARTFNASMVAGPDSQPITMTLQLPPSVTPTPDSPAPTAPPSTPAEVTAATNSGAAADLTATPREPFSVLSNTNEITVNLRVGGGNTPYTITLNWGDGSIESHVVDQPGEYSFSHSYQKNAAYVIRGMVRDVLGASTSFEYAVITGKPTASAGGESAGGSSGASVSFMDILRKYAILVAVIGSLAAVAGVGYLLGVHNSAVRLLRRRPPTRPKQRSRPRGKQPVKRRPKRPVRKQR